MAMLLNSESAAKGDSRTVLSEGAFSDLKATLRTYGSTLSPQAHEALRSVLTTMESGLRGELPPSFFLSAIDPGSGKSLAVAMFLRAYKAAGFLPPTGVLICVSRLAEIDTYLNAAGLDREDVAVLTSDERLNALGAPQALHDQAPVMFTTQQRLEARGGGSTMAGLSAFFYRGGPRGLRIWDECILPGSDKMVNVDDLGALLGPLRASKPQMAAAVQSLMLQAWEAEDGGVLSVPQELSGSWGRVSAADGAAKAVSTLAGTDVRVIDYSGDKRLAGAARSLPADFAPAVVLDASGRVRSTYRLWESRSTNLTRLPAAVNDYRDMVVHLWRRASSSRTLSEPTVRLDIAKAIAEKIAERPGEEWLVINYRDAGALTVAVRSLVGPEVATRVHELTWGRHHGTNAYAHVPNIVIVGYLNYGAHGYAALAAAAIGEGTAPELTKTERDELQAGELAHQLLQAVCRSSARKAQDGIAGACRVYLCISRVPDLEATLDVCFPGHRRREWAPSDREGLGGRNGQLVDYLAKRFATGRDVVVTKQEARQALGLQASALSRCLKDEAVLDALYDLEVEVDWSSFRRAQMSFEAYPAGGLMWAELAS